MTLLNSQSTYTTYETHSDGVKTASPHITRRTVARTRMIEKGSLIESIIRVRHRGIFNELLARYPSITVYFWCNRKHEILEVVGNNQDEYKKVVKEVSKYARLMDEHTNGLNARFVTYDCICKPENSVELIMDDLNIVHVSPMICREGWKYYSMIAFNQKDISTLIDILLGKGYVVDIIEKVPFDGALSSTLLSTNAVFFGLTQKQRKAVLTAFGHGYYRYPRKANLQEISTREHKPRTTYQEHLKRGENKLISALIPYLRLFEKKDIDEM